MKILNKLSALSIAAIASIALLSSCSDTKSYAERLVDENKAVNLFLSNYRVENSLPEDNNFEVGPEAPYYRLDDEGNIYMQVLHMVDGEENMATDDQLISFRWERHNLLYAYNYGEDYTEGNLNDLSMNPTLFRFNNTANSSSTQWGTGIQMPLNYLGIGSIVNIVIKSQYGFTSEIANVTPYMYMVCYYLPLSN
ncbi:MAG: DUF4827 domain-containing protein [Muribaculaceae bacterium]|nr:DUF4827 domain-containing protein [Muribaculaceae bacterium]